MTQQCVTTVSEDFHTGFYKSVGSLFNIQNLIYIIILTFECQMHHHAEYGNGTWLPQGNSHLWENYGSFLINRVPFWLDAKKLLLSLTNKHHIFSYLPLFLFVFRCVVPDIVVETPVLDFQRCYINQSNEQQVRLRNISSVPVCYGMFEQVTKIIKVVCVCVLYVAWYMVCGA